MCKAPTDVISRKMAQEEQSTVGFIGLGIMGKGMIRNLLTKLDPSLSFVVWNRSSEPSEELVNQFPGRVRVGASPADVVRQSAVTYSMLSTEDASVEVVGAVQTEALMPVDSPCLTASSSTLLRRELSLACRRGRSSSTARRCRQSAWSTSIRASLREGGTFLRLPCLVVRYESRSIQFLRCSG